MLITSIMHEIVWFKTITIKSIKLKILNSDYFITDNTDFEELAFINYLRKLTY